MEGDKPNLSLDPLPKVASRTHDRGPRPEPLDQWEEYAQILLISNEFAFVD